MAARERFRETLRRLRHHYPTPIRSQVRFVSAGYIKKQLGFAAHGMACVLEDSSSGLCSAVIYLDKAASEPVTCDALIHEWAHVHDDPTGECLQRHHHRNGWGACYARAYRASMTPI